MLSTPVPMSTIHLAHFAGTEDATQLLDRRWTKTQLQAAAEMDRSVQRHPQHMVARMALANHGDSVNLERIRASVRRSLDGIAGTHYIVAALHLAYLALAFPQALSATQRALLLAPLEAAEAAGAAADSGSTNGEIAA
ncbi:hypothetical protein GCM10009589_08910 [Arthrobacter pascens]|nr:hypothetical protein [Arthrobacter pascens]